ncbi:hypothetical protein MKW98_020991 [Papaver atlanticum]|uniref:Uncharacterized protein n=1 Tax=Papaver atlanticum TaxID=357466 RepID=A0AAD4SMN2_9MAGN|nr:hypothetical protein MKW98_020991 [Papaver atlanticum]
MQGSNQFYGVWKVDISSSDILGDLQVSQRPPPQSPPSINYDLVNELVWLFCLLLLLLLHPLQPTTPASSLHLKIQSLRDHRCVLHSNG